LIPRVFIGSSVEGLNVAYAIQENLEYRASSTVWPQGVFELSRPAAQSLVTVLDRMDFGVFVFTPDDVVNMRGQQNTVARDNVVFELGLFVGRLGQERSFIVMPRDAENLHLPTDLVGMTAATYNPGLDAELVAITGPMCNRLWRAMDALGPRIREIRASNAPETPAIGDDQEGTADEMNNRTNDPGGDIADYMEEPSQLRAQLAEAQRTIHELQEELGKRAPRHLGEFRARQIGVSAETDGLKAENKTLKDENERLRKKAAPQPNELKALCLHLSEELDQEDMMYKDGEESIRSWRTELEAAGLSESEIDEKIESARDENTIGALNRYNQHLKGRLLELYDTLAPRGWFGTVDRHRFENLYDPNQIHNLAKRLREVCNKLPSG
jgi:hypothetical protein